MEKIKIFLHPIDEVVTKTEERINAWLASGPKKTILNMTQVSCGPGSTSIRTTFLYEEQEIPSKD